MAAGCIQEWIDYDLQSRWIRRYYTYPTGRWTDWKEAPLFKEQFIKSSEKGKANGIATLNASGAIDSRQIPPYLENPLVYAQRSNFPATGRPGKIYMDEQTGKLYVYSGTEYKEYTDHIGITKSILENTNIAKKDYVDNLLKNKSNIDHNHDTKYVKTSGNSTITAPAQNWATAIKIQ